MQLPALHRASRAIVTHPAFRSFVFGVILLNAAVIGLETYDDLYERHFALLHGIDRLCLGLFTVEIILRILAAGSLRAFVRDPWDCFDFAVVAVALLPLHVEQAGIARIFRLLRVLRTVTFLPQLRLLVATLLRTLPSLGNITILLGLLFYFFAVVGCALFSETLPEHFANLGQAALTLFGIVTLEGWVDVMQEAGRSNPYAWVYFVSFILLGTFVIVNLFVAVVVNNLEQSFQELEAAKLSKGISDEELLRRLQGIYSAQAARSSELEVLITSIRATRRQSDPG